MTKEQCDQLLNIGFKLRSDGDMFTEFKHDYSGEDYITIKCFKKIPKCALEYYDFSNDKNSYSFKYFDTFEKLIEFIKE